MRDKKGTLPPEEIGPRIVARLEDIPELERSKKGIIKILKKFGHYEPEVDDILVERIAIACLYAKKSESFLDAPTASEYTYTRVTDVQAKQQKMIEQAMQQLAITRRERVQRQGESNFVQELRKEIEKMMKT